jgi:hypothetical protein
LCNQRARPMPSQRAARATAMRLTRAPGLWRSVRQRSSNPDGDA